MQEVEASSGALFQDSNVSVTRTLFKVGSASYPISGIVSVLVYREQVRYKNVRALIVVCFLVFVFQIGSTPIISGIAAAIAGVTVICKIGACTNVLSLGTASGSEQALRSDDNSYLENVKAALERAINLRG